MRAGLLALALMLAACGNQEPPTPSASSFTIDANKITVSGVSSGAMMATQMHVAHSALFSGVALVSGGPYFCAEGSIAKGLGPCMKGGDVGLDRLADYARMAAQAKLIDDLSNLEGDPVWLFLGASDTVMHRDATDAAGSFYEGLTGQSAILVDSVSAAHGFPVVSDGVACDQMISPFLNACNYDAAGEMLNALYENLLPAGNASLALIEVPQPGAADAFMLPSAFAYVPQSCRDGAACGVHIAFHGCLQSSAFVGDAFAAGAGFNEWAETNKLIVLYPQVDSSKFAPLNPSGCWDWWGYTDANYATKNGAQISVVKATLDALAGKTL